jgi:hypothetical protein
LPQERKSDGHNPNAGSSRPCNIRTASCAYRRFPLRFDGASRLIKPSQLLGEQTTEVFGDWLGMSAGDVKGLRDGGMV